MTYDRRGGTVTILTKTVRTWWKNLDTRPEISLRLAGEDHVGRAHATVGDAASVPRLVAFLERNSQDARAYGVTFDEAGRPDDARVRAVSRAIRAALAVRRR